MYYMYEPLFKEEKLLNEKNIYLYQMVQKYFKTGSVNITTRDVLVFTETFLNLYRVAYCFINSLYGV